jgi:cell division protein FtsA
MTRLGGGEGTNEGLRRLGQGKPAQVTSLDLGASKVACFIMTPEGVRHADRTIRVAHMGYVQSRGVKGGALADLEQAADAISHAVQRAERDSQDPVSGVIVTTAIGQQHSNRVGATVSLGTRPIRDADLVRTIASALAKANFPGRRPIHLLPIRWAVDNGPPVRDPRGLTGDQLSLDLLVVTMAETAFTALSHCLSLAHLDLEGVVSAPFMSALSALEEDEKDLGCACIDMGGGSTTAAVFAGGSLVHVDGVPVGGNHVTQDIARGLSTTLNGAERIKTIHGSCMASAHEYGEQVEAPARGDDPGAPPIRVDRGIVTNIIAPRVEETLELVRDRLKKSGAPFEPGAGVVLTGGASQLVGVREMAVRVFDGRPVRLARPMRSPHLADAASGPAFCAATGVLVRAAYGPREAVSAKKMLTAKIGPAAAPQVQAGWAPKIIRWVAENF